jgi:hypothetical protein
LYKYHHTLFFVVTYIIKWSKLGSYLHNASIWGQFSRAILVKIWVFDPQGDHN